jgi:hypothetical protein
MPPAAGAYIGWDWDAFYLAILSVLRNPRSGVAYAQSLNDINNLPTAMVFTLPILAAAWARFAVIFPQWDLKAAYRLMERFLQQTGRLQDDDRRAWYVIEQDWQGLEAQEDRKVQFIQYEGIGSNLGRLPVYDIASGGRGYIPLRSGIGVRAYTGRSRMPRVRPPYRAVYPRIRRSF